MASILLTLEGDGTDRPEFVNPDHKYDCPVCHKILWNPIQTPCGHRICDPCIMRLLLDTDPSLCPVGEDTCEYITLNPKNFFRDVSTIRDVQQFDVHCSNAKYGCEIIIQWRYLSQHLNECRYAFVDCPKKHLGCDEPIRKLSLEEHIQSECKYRDLICQHCDEVVAAHRMKEHLDKECPKVEIKCPYQCGMKGILREELSEHQQVCPVKPVDCRYAVMGCEFKGSIDQNETHLSQDVQKHLDLTISCVKKLELENADLRRQVQEGNNERDLMQSEYSAKIRKLEMTLVNLQERVIKLEDSMKACTSAVSDVEGHSAQLVGINETLQELQTKIRTLESRPAGTGVTSATPSPDAVVRQVRSQERQLAVQDVRLAEIDLRFQVLETATYNGVLLWKIRDYPRRKKDAVDRKTLSLYSQPFYTSRHGYRMCARVYLNGDGMGKGSHLSLFFVVMRGEYDALLPWPFRQKVTLMLLDQEGGRRHLSDSFRPDPTSTSFKQPTSEMNVASGCPLFVPQSVVESPPYFKNDTIFLKIIVDTSGIPEP